MCSFTLPDITFYYRYLELVHPLWHKTHFRIRWIYITLVANVILSVTFHFSYYIPSAKVRALFDRLLSICNFFRVQNIAFFDINFLAFNGRLI